MFQGLVAGRGHAAEQEHFSGEFQRHLHEILGATTFEALHRLPDLQRVADGSAKRRVHARDQGLHRLAEFTANPRHAFGKRDSVLPLRHEGAVAGLDVEHKGIDALGKLLGEDRGGDQRDALHRGRRVAKGVEHAVGRRDLGRLADEHQAAFPSHAPVGREIEVDAKARDALEFVQGAAGVPQAAARDHRHRHAAGRHDRGQNQARLVTDTTGRVLVDFRARNVGEVDHRARMKHRLDEGRGLGGRHAPPEDRHRQGRPLVLRHLAAGDATDEESDLVGRELTAVTLPANQIDGPHAEGSC